MKRWRIRVWVSGNLGGGRTHDYNAVEAETLDEATQAAIDLARMDEPNGTGFTAFSAGALAARHWRKPS